MMARAAAGSGGGSHEGQARGQAQGVDGRQGVDTDTRDNAWGLVMQRNY